MRAIGLCWAGFDTHFRSANVNKGIKTWPLSILLMAGTAMPAFAEVAKPVASPAAANVMLDPWAGPYDGVPPWDKVKPADFPAAFEEAMKRTKAEFEAILTNPAPVTFDNTIKANELAGASVSRLFSIWGVHSSNLSNPEIRKIQAEWEPKISAFFNELQLDARWFQRVQYLYQERENLGLDKAQMRLLERTYDGLSATARCSMPNRRRNLSESKPRFRKSFPISRTRFWPTKKPIFC
jgi:hypothetical protein